MAKKIKFLIVQYPTQENGLIVLRLNHKAKRYQITTGIAVPVKYWNKNAQRVKENRSFPYYAQINQRLNVLESDTLNLFYDYIAQGIVPTLEQFKADWIAKTTGQPKQQAERVELLQFIEQFIHEKKAMNKPKGSLTVYGSCLKHLQGYEKAQKKKLSFSSLDKNFTQNFTAYLFELGFMDSYSHKIITTLRTIVREAENRELAKDTPFLKSKLNVKKREADKVYLNDSEIRILFDMHLEGRLANVRDLFLIGCLTGLRFSDFSQLKPENIQQIEHQGKRVECLVITSQKTKQKTVLPIVNPMLKELLQRMPKAISSQKLNDYIKELCKLAGFTQEIEINEFIAGSQVKRKVQRWEIIASHTARRSFATNAYKAGMAVPDIMKFTGHTTVASFMKYIRVTTEETAVYLSEHDFFTGKNG